MLYGQKNGSLESRRPNKRKYNEEKKLYGETFFFPTNNIDGLCNQDIVKANVIYLGELERALRNENPIVGLTDFNFAIYGLLRELDLEEIAGKMKEASKFIRMLESQIK